MVAAHRKPQAAYWALRACWLACDRWNAGHTLDTTNMVRAHLTLRQRLESFRNLPSNTDAVLTINLKPGRSFLRITQNTRYAGAKRPNSCKRIQIGWAP
jgi:hypothetical protein